MSESMFTISQRLVGLCETFREKYQRPGTLTLGVVNAIAQVSVVLLKHIEDRQQLPVVPRRCRRFKSKTSRRKCVKHPQRAHICTKH